jgi:outer membrane lipoprotein-sorting protein
VSADLIARACERFLPLLVVLGVVLVSSCTKSRPATDGTDFKDQIISSTPPFQTKEPEQYQAVRTITFTDSSGKPVVTKTVIARYGELRRDTTESGSNQEIVLLDSDQGRLILLPQAKIYSEANGGTPSEVNPDPQLVETSPDRLLHSEPSITTYQKLGTESVSGREATKYRVVVNISAAGNVSSSETLIWVDEILGMPIKSETKAGDGSSILMEMSNIVLEVDKGLFQIPPGYERVANAELRRRLRKN